MSALVCGNCGRACRPVGVKKAEQPGTLALVALGLCTTCYNLTRITPKPTKPTVAPEPDYETTRCVLVRVDLMPATYKALRVRGANIGALLSLLADTYVEDLNR